MPRPLRVLHVVGGLNRAGTETWLVSLLKYLAEQQIHCDFVVDENKNYAYSEQVKSCGSKILVCNQFQNRLRFGLQFFKLLKQNGPYDIVHSHIHWYSGYVLLLAKLAGVRERIAHAHNDTSSLDASAPFRFRVGVYVMDILLRHFATGGLAASERAGRTFLREKWRSSGRWTVQVPTSELSRFKPVCRNRSLCAELNITQDSLVIGHVGRLVHQKNHELLINAFSELLKRQPNSYLVCIGEGAEKDKIEALAVQLGVSDHLRLLPSTDRVHEYVTGLFDLLTLQSRYEGLGIVAVEAQAAGIPVMLSDQVPEEARVIPEIAQVLALEASPKLWAESMLATKMRFPLDLRNNFFQKVFSSSFHPRKNAKDLGTYYRMLVGQAYL